MNEDIELPKLHEKTENTVNEVNKNDKKDLTLWEVFKKVHVFLTHADGKDIAKFVLELVLICIVVICFKLPFSLIISLGPDIFNSLSIGVTDAAIAFWNISFDVLYVIVAIWYYLKVFKERYWNIDVKYQKKMEDKA